MFAMSFVDSWRGIAGLRALLGALEAGVLKATRNPFIILTIGFLQDSFLLAVRETCVHLGLLNSRYSQRILYRVGIHVERCNFD